MMARAVRFLTIAACVGLILVSGVSAADEDGISYARARSLAHAGERDAAREMCRALLRERPDDRDTRVLLGRLHAWDREWDAARREFDRVLAARPAHADASSARADVELWSGRPTAALRVLAPALEAHPDDPELWFRQARALRAVDRPVAAHAAAVRAAELDPDGPAVAYAKTLETDLRRNRIRIDGLYEEFDDDTEAWEQVSLAWNRRFDWGSGIARVNRAERFGRDGTQFEIDAYPKIPAWNSYLYLNVGISDSEIFPDLRYGAEWFHNFDGGWEGSIGFRHLEFDSSEVTLYTGTIGKYRGRSFVWLRPFWSDREEGTSYSGTLFWRRYFGDDRYSYWTLYAGAGSSPDDDLTTPEVDRLDSRRVGFEWQRRFRDVWAYRLRAAWREEEFAFGERERLSWGIGLQRWF